MKPNEIMNKYRWYLGNGAGYPEAAASLVVAEVASGDEDCDSGVITLSQGRHTVSLTTDQQPTKVYLWLEDEGQPVCHANINMANAIINPQGFEIVADIQTDSCNVHYIVC